jgi:hypothetical protein
MGTLFTVNGTTGDITTSGAITSTSTTSGFQPPSMTTTQRNAIPTPADGLIVYDTTLHQLWEWQNGVWTQLSTGGGSGTVNTGVAGRLSLYNTSTNAVSDTYVQNTHPITLTIASQGSRTSDLALTIPNPGNAVASGNLLMDSDTGTYTIAGNWSFTNDITLASTEALILTDGTTNTITLQAPTSVTTYTLKLPSTAGTANYFLQTDGTGVTTWAAGSGGGTPAGANTQVQFNNSGAFGADAGFTFTNPGSHSPSLSLSGSNSPSITLTTTSGGGVNIFYALNASSPDYSSILFNNSGGSTLNGEIRYQGTVLDIMNWQGTDVRIRYPNLSYLWNFKNDGGFILNSIGSRPISPVGGEIIHNSNTAHLEYYDSAGWETVIGNVAKASVINTTSSITTTTLYTPAFLGTGTYRVSIYIVDTGADGVYTLQGTIGWTDSAKAQTATTSTLTNASDGYTQSSFFIEVISGSAITYAVALTGTATYSVYVVAERLS